MMMMKLFRLTNLDSFDVHNVTVLWILQVEQYQVVVFAFEGQLLVPAL